MQQKKLFFGRGKLNRLFVFTFRSTLSNSEINREESFWRVTSNVRLISTVSFLQLYAFQLWDVLSLDQIQLISDMPGVLTEELLIALKARKDLGWYEVYRRTRNWNRFWKKKISFGRPVLQQWNGNMRIEAELVTFPIRPHKRYSGYVRNSSAVGSKRRSTFNRPETEFSELKVDMINIFEKYLTVGYISSNSGAISLPDEP